MWKSNEECFQIDVKKAHHGYWDCWTGSRYERIKNPYLTMDFRKARNENDRKILQMIKNKQIIVDETSVIYHNTATDEWEPV